MDINNRRYTGSKFKLINWISEVLRKHCLECSSMFDVFGGTGIVTASLIDEYDHFIINDFLFSNEVIYKAFFGKEGYNYDVVKSIAEEYKELDYKSLCDNYVSKNYGDKYFRYEDAKAIGYIREDLEIKKNNQEINEKEFNILLASLLYSFDRCANTVGHYEAYIKNKQIRTKFEFDLIEPIDIKGKRVSIYRQDSNELAKEVKADIAFIDPPYNSRQYSRFYHVMENITKWEKPQLSGVAMKPPEENMSEYCRNNAVRAFKDLIDSLDVKYIAVTYNNTYNSKSSSSRNKITLDEIENILGTKGETIVYEKDHQCFNAGKTEFNGHKELLFITKVGKINAK